MIRGTNSKSIYINVVLPDFIIIIKILVILDWKYQASILLYIYSNSYIGPRYGFII